MLLLYFTQRGRDNENKLNESYMRQKIGSPVVFGDIIQLLHVKSGKFITIVPDQLARDERENIRVALTSEGCTYSWLQVLPRYKIDREGDRILSNTEALLKVAERPNEYIHCSEKLPPAGYFREVNCSLETSSWRLTIFQTGKDTADKSLLLTAQLVFIHDPETRSNITALPNYDELDAELKRDVGEIAIQPVSSSGELDTNSLWMIESKSIVQGGPIQWKSDQIRFRNLNTGKYLTLEQVTYQGEVRHQLGTAASSTNPATLFNIQELYSTGVYLTTGKALQLYQGGVWLERGEFIDELNVYQCCGTRDRAAAINLLVHRYSERAEDETKGPRPMIEEPLDVFVGVACRNFIKKCYDRTVINISDFSSGTVWPGSDRSELKFFETIVERIVLFARGYAISAENILLQDKPDDLLRSNRQSMICDQGCLKLLILLLEKLIPISQLCDSTVVQATQKSSVPSDDEKAVIRMAMVILQQSLRLLYYTVAECPRNQMFVADYLPILLAHVGVQELAAKCFTEMLNENMELQETKISVREISIFTEKLRMSKMNSMYLNLLKATCSCRGRGVTGNQITVAEVVFKDLSDIIIQVHADYSKMTKIDWGNVSGLYIPSTPEPSSPIMGMDLITRGVPELSLSWTTRSIDFSPLGLFGKLSVNILDLYQPNSGSEDSLRKSNSQQKQTVADYFTSEIFLAADMCLDRNYIAMQRLEKLFPYEILVSMMKLHVKDVLKSAAVNLILRLYVDRDPQVISNIPTLTRTWSSVTKNEVPQLPYVEPVRKNTFALLQQTISEHIRCMHGTHWDGFSVNIMLLMNKLIMFNFYGTNEKLKDVILPIIAALDRRRVEVIVKQEHTSLENSPAKVGKLKTKPSVRNMMSSASLRAESRVAVTMDDMDKEKENSAELEHTEIDPAIEGSWQKKVLDFLEDLIAMSLVVLLVIVAIAVTVYQSISGVTNDGYRGFDIFVVAVFLCEITLRFYCYGYVHREVGSFFKEPLNIVDIGVVVIDLVILGTPSLSGGGAEYAKALRAFRLVRLVRVFRAARLMKKLADLGVVTYDPWKCPVRYYKTPPHELQTMIAAVEILSYVQRIIEDRNLSLLLRGFYRWEKGDDGRTPGEIFEQVILQSKELSLGCESFDDIFIDLLMYVNPTLVQVCLDVLMAHHSSRIVLLENISKVQLLVSARRERQYKLIDQMLLQLERNAETHELWGLLRTEEDHRINKQTKDILHELIDACRSPKTVLEFDHIYEPDREIQNVLRNLGFFDVCFKVLNLLTAADNEESVGGTSRELPIDVLNKLEIVAISNELLYWFVIDNPQNQEMCFERMDFFLDSLDSGIHSDRIIHAMFRNNEKLMRAVPKHLIGEFTEKVCKYGRQPQYLALLSSINFVGDKNILENQYEIVKHIIAPVRLHHMVNYFCPVADEEYAEKVELMKPFLSKGDVNIDDLPSELAYHLEFLRVLSGCTVGRINITTVEAKVQSVYQYTDIIDAMLDPRAIYLAKTRLGQFLFNAMIEVEMVIPGIAENAVVWRFIESTIPLFETAVEELRLVQRHGWEASNVSRQKMEYVITCIMIIAGFFQVCYDPSRIKAEETIEVHDRVQMTISEVNELIGVLYEKIKAIYDLNSPNIDETHKAFIYEALSGLLKGGGKQFNNVAIERNYVSQMTADDDTEDPAQGNSSEVRIAKRFEEFVSSLTEDEEVRDLAKTENRDFIGKIEKLPFLADNCISDVRYEPFIKKLVAHARDRLEIVRDEKRLDAKCAATTTWIIRSFRTMIENRWKMTIYERDEDGGEEEDEAAAPVIEALNKCGATTLCLDLISVGIDPSLMLESVKLCVAMLFKEGGNLEVQQTMHEYLQENDSTLFFQQLRISLQKLIAWHKWNEVVILEDGEDPDLPEDVVIVRFMQLMCEGHYGANQDIMREQPNNSVSINLLDDLVQFLNCLSRIPCRTSTDASIRVSATILEVIQGPCERNQEHFALNTELIETLNRLMRAKTMRDCVEEEELELKKTAIDIIQGLLEGQGRKSVVYERVLSVIHLDVIQMMCSPENEGAEMSEEAVMLQTECLVLIQMLCDYKPSLRNELEFVKDAADIVGTGVACVEIQWRGELQRRFFHVPDICSNLAKASKDALVEDVDRSNQENKLQDFVVRCDELYREVKHQEVLKQYKVSGIFSRSNQDKATWISFFLALIINFLLLVFYTAESGEPKLPTEVRYLVDALNIFQIVFATFTLVLFLIVRVPVRYKSYIDSGHSQFQTILYTMTDPLTMYYFIYLTICVLGVNVSDIFLTLLLLDIVVKNSTTRDVLYAVIYPRKQLAMTLLLGIFVMYIFSFIIVSAVVLCILLICL